MVIDDSAIFQHASPRAHAALGADGCVEGGSRWHQPSGGIRRRFVPSARAERRLKMMEG